jgi:hypothetical protein
VNEAQSIRQKLLLVPHQRPRAARATCFTVRRHGVTIRANGGQPHDEVWEYVARHDTRAADPSDRNDR